MGQFDLEKASKADFSNAAFTGSESYLYTDGIKQGGLQKRSIIIIVVLAAVFVIALSVGLGVGLHKKSDSSSSSKSQQKGTINPYLPSSKASVTPPTGPSTSGPPTSTSGPAEPNWMSQPCSSQRSPPKCPWSKNPLLLVSLDGFRAEYLLRNYTPVIQRLRGCGVHTPYMRSVYPTLTFPNHYSIVTGLYPASHGLVGNSMYDPHINASYSISSKEKSNPAWYSGEPLWTTAKKQGKRTASYFWVGSDVNISGVQPDIWEPYDGKKTFEERVDTVLGWLRQPEGERPDFITLYFDEPDHQAHGTGPNSPQVDAMLKRVDRIIERLMDGLLRQDMDHCVNLIVLADHGMAPTTCDRQVDLNKYMPNVYDYLIYSGTTGHINPKYRRKSSRSKTVLKNDPVDDPSKIVEALECKDSHLNVYTKDTIPVRHHYTHNERIGAVVMDIEQSWLVSPKHTRSCLKGNHGYDNIYKSMHALFLAHGPDFKESIEVEPFENIELYNLMSDLLEIEPSPNNGTRGALQHIMKSPPTVGLPTPPQYKQCQLNIRNTSSSSCSCNNQTFVPGPFPMEQLYGLPYHETDTSICLLTGNSFFSGYSSEHKMASWTTFTLSAQQVTKYNQTNQFCTVSDPRLSDENNPACDFYQNTSATINPEYLYDPGFSVSGKGSVQALLTSNVVPMYRGFKDTWQFLSKLIGEYTAKYENISVTTGPAFDNNFDGLADKDVTNFTVNNSSTVPLPTHYYLILAKCSNKSVPLTQCTVEDLDTLSFILPHKNKTSNCETHIQLLQNNIARIRDIELLTGLRFLTSFKSADSARLRTILTIDLWQAPALMSWKDLPCSSASKHTCTNKPPLLLISLDGFRADYLTRNLTPTIKKLAECGVHTPYMRSVYPTVTFPNHYTIVTGLYPESHGIIGNHMYDKEIDKKFSLSAATAKDPRWWKGEPLWITAKSQGLKTATYFWPGSDVNISGVYPDHWEPYNNKAGFVERIDVIMSWLMLPADQRPEFLTLYFDQPDHAGHQGGPDSEVVNGQLQTVDGLIDLLMTKLYERDLHNCINIIVLADHGMSSQSCSRTVYTKDYSSTLTNTLMFGGVMGNMMPQYTDDKRGVLLQNHSIPDIVESLTCRHPTMKVFTKDTLPKRHHFTNSQRIGDVLLDMKDEWLIFGSHKGFCTGGNHGWDNINKEMHALFLAHGPAFKENYTADPFENIELYNMMCDVLNITAAPNNGTEGSLNSLLKSPHPIANEKTFKYDSCTTQAKKTLTCNCSSPLMIYGSTNEVPYFGQPLLTRGETVCELYQNEYSIGYSMTRKAPLWLSTVLTHQKKATTWGVDDFCLLQDGRTDSVCPVPVEADNIVLTPLITAGPNDNRGMAAQSSSLVPMYTGFKNGVWQTLLKLLDEYRINYGKLFITMGTIYDYNNDGLWEGITNETLFADDNQTIPIPTHIYITIIKCRTKGASFPCDGDVDILSFILQNLQEVPNCLSMEMYLKDNVARIRDIELLTGLQFLTNIDAAVAAKLRTFLPENIWSSTLFPKWLDQPCPQKDMCKSDYRPLLLVSLDGFRADYLIRNFTPTIARLSQCGAHAPFMRSVYPTKTYPNHYSIVTGLYPESHGIIDNNMYDLNLKLRFSMGSSSSFKPDWWGGEPVWLTAQRQGLKAGTYFWPGSDVKIGGKRPDIWKKYDGSATFSGRVQEVLSWMKLPAGERPDFMTLYFDEPDLAGHKSGPSQIEAIGAALEKVDKSINELMSGLYQYNLHHCVNLVIIADHGMSDISCDKVVRLGNIVDYSYLSSNFWVWDGPVGRISNAYKYKRGASGGIAATEHPEPIDRLVANLTCGNPHLNTYTKSSLPVRHHYSNNKRIDDIVLDMEAGWLVARNYIKYCNGGNHGYDNIDKSMEALFLAYGPAFKWNYTVEPFENIELYNLFTEILNITSAPNNGTAGTLDHILQNPVKRSTTRPDIPYSNVLDTFNSLGDFANFSKLYCNGSCESQSKLADLYNASSKPSNDSDHMFGLPAITSLTYANRHITLLYDKGYVTCYDADNKKTIWISRTFSSVRSTRSTTPGKLQTMVNTFDAEQGKLFGDVVAAVSYKLADLMIEYKGVNFMSGFVYDLDHDSLPDSNINSSTVFTHFFAILTTCKDTEIKLEDCSSYRTNAYIVPRQDGNQKCKAPDEYLIDVEARVRDVEIITGFEFFTGLPFDQAVRLRTYLPQRP